jgi:uncharacterized protein (TIGR03382 family)
MNRNVFSAGVLSLLAAGIAFAESSAHATESRDEIMTRARAYAAHPWSATSANLTAACSAPYKSVYVPGDFVGLAYNWGGYQTLAEFDQNIAKGLAAGAQPSDGILACTAGVDCSGFVSKSWGVGHFTTSSLDQTSAAITAAQMLPGDVYNKAGYHVAMWSENLANGTPVFYEAYGYNVNRNAVTGISHVNGYTPRRLNGVVGTTAADPVGTLTKPIDIAAFPYADARNTQDSTSRLLDVCGASPTKQEGGSEFVYRATFTQPGTLVATIADDATTDVDVELFTSLQTNACVARGDTSVNQVVGCGTYYLLVDTFGTAANTNAGPYQLNVTFTPSGQPCAAVPGPPAFNPKGKLGDACGYPGNPNLPFCNPTNGTDTCIYTSSDSFCSKPCATDPDCGDLPGGGCCEELSKGELYCVTKALCGSGTTPSTTGPDAGTGGAGGSGGTGGTGGGTGGAAGKDGGTTTGAGSNETTDPTTDGTGATSPKASGCNATSTTPAEGFSILGLALGALALTRRRRT